MKENNLTNHTNKKEITKRKFVIVRVVRGKYSWGTKTWN